MVCHPSLPYVRPANKIDCCSLHKSHLNRFDIVDNNIKRDKEPTPPHCKGASLSIVFLCVMVCGDDSDQKPVFVDCGSICDERHF